MSRFAITRTDGKSNVQVLLDYLKGAEPGRTFSYAELRQAMSTNAARQFSIADVRGVVGQAYTRLLKEQQRAIHSVRGVGYRIAYASEQTGLAMSRKRRSDTQLKAGLATLENVAWNELTPAARQAHEGSLMVFGALWQNQRALERRQSAVEQAIAGLTQRVDAIASK